MKLLTLISRGKISLETRLLIVSYAHVPGELLFIGFGSSRPIERLRFAINSMQKRVTRNISSTANSVQTREAL